MSGSPLILASCRSDWPNVQWLHQWGDALSLPKHNE
jgi:hypothetical protein